MLRRTSRDPRETSEFVKKSENPRTRDNKPLMYKVAFLQLAAKRRFFHSLSAKG
jgi:hypothetical protein